SAAGLGLGLAVLPAVAFGPRQTVAYAREYAAVLLRPVVSGSAGGESRAQELLSAAGSHSQSLLGVAHTTLYPAPAGRPAQAPAGLRWLAWLAGAALTALTLRAAGRRGRETRHGTALFLGTLIVLMLLVSPVCRLHYLCLWL